PGGRGGSYGAGGKLLVDGRNFAHLCPRLLFFDCDESGDGDVLLDDTWPFGREGLACFSSRATWGYLLGVCGIWLSQRRAGRGNACAVVAIRGSVDRGGVDGA